MEEEKGPMSMSTVYRVGDLVKISPACPIDFEGVGPLPGDCGEIVSSPRQGDARSCFAVRMGRQPSHWLIPGEYLVPVFRPVGR